MLGGRGSEWVSLPVRPPNESLSGRSTAALPLQGRAVSRWPRLRSKPLRSKPPLAETLSHRPHRPRGPDPWPGANSPGFAGPPGPHSARGLVWALALQAIHYRRNTRRPRITHMETSPLHERCHENRTHPRSRVRLCGASRRSRGGPWERPTDRHTPEASTAPGCPARPASRPRAGHRWPLPVDRRGSINHHPPPWLRTCWSLHLLPRWSGHPGWPGRTAPQRQRDRRPAGPGQCPWRGRSRS